MHRNPHMKLTFFQADGQWAFTWGKHDVVRLRHSTQVFFNKVEDAVRAAARLRLQVLENGDVVTETGEEHVPLEMDDKFAPDGTYQRTYGQTFNALRRNPVSRLMGKTLRTRTGASIMVTLDLEKPQPYSVVLVEGETATSWDFDTRADAQAAAEELRREIDGPRQNPLRAEHSARQHAPEGYKSCGRVTIHHDDKPIGLLTCSPTGRRSAHDTEVASVRFPVEHWTAKQAKAWLKENGYSTARFKEGGGSTRRNPSSSFSAEDVFGDEPTFRPSSPRDSTVRLIQSLRRGDVVKVGTQKFDVFRGDGSVTVYMIKHGSSGKKYYSMQYADDGTVDVYQCDGMANLVGDPVASGVLSKVGHVEMR